MEAMNRSVALSMQSGMLMTCCYVLIDPSRGTLQYTNAGHNSPFILGAGDIVTRLDSTDILLGVPGFENRPFTSRTVSWSKGDVLVVFSDGITESTNEDEEMFEEERLEQILKRSLRKTAPEIKAEILDAMAAFTGARPQADDVTLVVARAL